MADGFVYFIGAADLAEPVVKIGFTSNDPSARKSALQTGSPYALDVIVYACGSQADEAQLHERFSDFRMAGEWFALEGSLQAYVSDLVRNTPPQMPAPTLWTETYLSEGQ